MNIFLQTKTVELKKIPENQGGKTEERERTGDRERETFVSYYDLKNLLIHLSTQPFHFDNANVSSFAHRARNV